MSKWAKGGACLVVAVSGVIFALFLGNIKTPPGVVIAHSPILTGRCIGSPSFVILPDGEYLASHDFFGPTSGEFSQGITRIFASRDGGKTWTRRAEVPGAFWSGLFVHGGKLYLLGVDRRPEPTGGGLFSRARPRQGAGNRIVIRRSEDAGRTWTHPGNETSGVLRTGRFGFAPTPPVLHRGRLWRAQGAGMLSAPADADLLLAESWLLAAAPEADRKRWLGGGFEGWSEGSAVVAPDGTVVNLAKVRYFVPGQDRAALIAFDHGGSRAVFDGAVDFVRMPGARLKFTVRFDPVTGLYFALTNFLPERYFGSAADMRRNVVALVSSADLRAWRIERIVLEHPDTKKHGFQYLDWDFDRDDIVAVCRTAWPDRLGSPLCQHDSNYLTFHRIENFRSPPSAGNR